MSKNEKISTGSVKPKKILRTSSFRGSMRETISRALKSTLGISDKRGSVRESPTHSSSLPRSSSSGSTNSLQQSSGFCSLSHLPPPSRKKPSSAMMSMSMYEPRSSCSYTGSSHASCSYLPCSPSLHTLRNFDYDDADDAKSVVSTASTSRFVACNPKRVKKHNLHTFLDSPVRLRKRSPADDCGFEVEGPRCASSVQSIPRSSSEFAAQDFLKAYHTPRRHDGTNIAPRAVSVSTIPSYSGSSTTGLLPPSNAERFNGFSTPVKPVERRAIQTTPARRISGSHFVTPNGHNGHSKKLTAPVHPRTRHSGREQAAELSGYLYQGGNGFNERIVDGPTTSNSPSVKVLEDRIRDLEAIVMRHRNSSPGSSSREHRSTDEAVVLNAEFAKSIVSKEVELERLRKENERLRNENVSYEQRQKDLKAELSRSKMEWYTTADELKRVLVKQSKLEQEYSRISTDMAASNENAVNDLERIIEDKETRIHRLLEECDQAKDENTKLSNSCRFLELQNADLIAHSQKQDQIIKDLKDKLEKARSHTDGSSDSGRTRSTRPYTKTNSSLGTSSSNSAPIGSAAFVNNLRRSLSNVALDTTRSFELTRTMSQYVRAHYIFVLESRFLAKNLIVVLREILEGRHPNMKQLLCLQRIESESENSDEEEIRDSTPMTVGSAERVLGKQDEAVMKFGNELDTIRKLITEIAAKARQFDGMPGCFLQ